jgi:hypothetical protein
MSRHRLGYQRIKLQSSPAQSVTGDKAVAGPRIPTSTSVGKQQQHSKEGSAPNAVAPATPPMANLPPTCAISVVNQATSQSGAGMVPRGSSHAGAVGARGTRSTGVPLHPNIAIHRMIQPTNVLPLTNGMHPTLATTIVMLLLVVMHIAGPLHPILATTIVMLLLVVMHIAGPLHLPLITIVMLLLVMLIVRPLHITLATTTVMLLHTATNLTSTTVMYSSVPLPEVSAMMN